MVLSVDCLEVLLRHVEEALLRRLLAVVLLLAHHGVFHEFLQLILFGVVGDLHLRWRAHNLIFLRLQRLLLDALDRQLAAQLQVDVRGKRGTSLWLLRYH